MVNGITNSAAFTANTESKLREMIRQNYNHPSIVFWGIGNERERQHRDEHAAEPARRHRQRGGPGPAVAPTPAPSAPTPARSTSTPRQRLQPVLRLVHGTYDDSAAFLDNLHSQPGAQNRVSEYGAGANVTQHALNPAHRARPVSGIRRSTSRCSTRRTGRRSKARPYLWGTFVWNMFDFAADLRNEGGQPGINDKGLVTYDRPTRKDAFYWYKANWTATPIVYITSRRWTHRTDAATEVKVYCNAASVTLTLNGASLGTRSSADRIFKWTGVTLRPDTTPLP